MFPALSEAKIKEVIFNGMDIRKFMKDKNIEKRDMNRVQKDYIRIFMK